MALRSIALMTLVTLGLCGSALAQGTPPAAGAATGRDKSAQAPRVGRTPREVRSARYRGGRGATWKTGRDAYGFMGSYGGCHYRGHAGPGGYRLDRNC